jgi:hypothetical protein
MILDVDPEPAMAHTRPLAVALAITLVAYSVAAVLDLTLSDGQSLTRTAAASPRQPGPRPLYASQPCGGSGGWGAVAVVGLVVLVAVAFGSRLGG